MMIRRLPSLLLLTMTILMMSIVCSSLAQAQEAEPSNPDPTPAPAKVVKEPVSPAVDQVKESTQNLTKQTQEEVDKIAKVVDEDPRAKTVAAGILQPIYLLAEKLAFPSFHWLAFGLMCAGVVSYLLQLVLGKLIVLTRMGFSLKEILSDIIGLAISLVGLVLTTQAAAENSTFTQSPAAVLSAAILGTILGFILYTWGQSQELQAVAGRTTVTPVKRP